MGVARLAAGVSLERASAELEVLASRLREEYPETNHDKTLRFERLKDFIVGDVRRPLWIVMGAVGVVLLIACANVANLLLVRASARRGEVAVRAALGASRARLMTQVLVESFVLALGGAALGLALGVGGVEWLKRLGPDAVPRIDEIMLDATVLAFSFAMTIVVALLFGLSPALRMARTSVIDHLRSDARSGDQPREGWSRGVLLTVEIAMSLVLLVGAGLLTRSLVELYDVDLGFDGREVVRFELSLPSARYDSPATLASFYQMLEERISALPDVQAVGSSAFPPLASARYGRSDVSFDWQPDPEPAAGRSTPCPRLVACLAFRSRSSEYRSARTRRPIRSAPAFAMSSTTARPRRPACARATSSLRSMGDPSPGETRTTRGRTVFDAIPTAGAPHWPVEGSLSLAALEALNGDPNRSTSRTTCSLAGDQRPSGT